jgi:cysteine synthase A
MSGTVLDAIGNTPIAELHHVVPPGCARIVAKLEWANPTGSMKDRMARAAIEAAERDGRLPPGGTVLEATMGTTGISLALVCAAKGYGVHIVFSDAFSDDKRRSMQAFGATVEDVPSDHGRITEALVKAMLARARELSADPTYWWCDQLNNRDAINGYFAMGEEIWIQTGGRIDALVHSVSTGHSILGAGRGLRQHQPELHLAAVEPAESAVLSGQASGSHRIEGIGVGFVPPLWEPDEIDEVLTVTTEDAKAMTRRLASEEGLFAGASSGANVVAAVRLAQRLGPGATVATILVDSGWRYLSTDLFHQP